MKRIQVGQICTVTALFDSKAIDYTSGGLSSSQTPVSPQTQPRSSTASRQLHKPEGSSPGQAYGSKSSKEIAYADQNSGTKLSSYAGGVTAEAGTASGASSQDDKTTAEGASNGTHTSGSGYAATGTGEVVAGGIGDDVSQERQDVGNTVPNVSHCSRISL